VWSLQTEIINAAEFQYRFNKGVFADYPTLVRSGQFQRTASRYIAPTTMRSPTDPLPGYLINLAVSPDGSSYQLSIQEKESALCAPHAISDETGVIFDGRPAEYSVE
jgi:hypothetical protein